MGGYQTTFIVTQTDLFRTAGAVKFNHGVGFYNATCRASKQFAFLVYDDENHGLSKQDKNTVDYRNRVLQWFDHYLKDEPGPKWITKGVPYLKQVERKKDEAKGNGEAR